MPRRYEDMNEPNPKVLRARDEICDGCMMCVLMCSIRKTGIANPLLARLSVALSEGDTAHKVRVCRHCVDIPCREACPVPDAMCVDEGTGAVLVDDALCTGCLACVDACPYEAIRVGPNGEILKCDLCGGDPTCVRYCPPRPEGSLPLVEQPGERCLRYAVQE
jgi:carbon-monoxide dehydrogenase iron sulfur subunit